MGSGNFIKASSILSNNDFVERMTKNSKYLKEEFQDFGIRIAHKLNDLKHKSLYIKLAKELPRSTMEQALSFTLDYPTKDSNLGKLYMWKLSELCKKQGIKIPSGSRAKKKKKTQQLSYL
jgi:hypothetical protein